MPRTTSCLINEFLMFLVAFSKLHYILHSEIGTSGSWAMSQTCHGRNSTLTRARLFRGSFAMTHDEPSPLCDCNYNDNCVTQKVKRCVRVWRVFLFTYVAPSQWLVLSLEAKYSWENKRKFAGQTIRQHQYAFDFILPLLECTLNLNVLMSAVDNMMFQHVVCKNSKS